MLFQGVNYQNNWKSKYIIGYFSIQIPAMRRINLPTFGKMIFYYGELSSDSGKLPHCLKLTCFTCKVPQGMEKAAAAT